MFRWRRKTEAPKLRSRSESRDGSRFTSGQAGELAPEKREFLARAAAHQLLAVEWRSEVIDASPDIPSKHTLLPIIDEATDRHSALLAELQRMRVRADEAVAEVWPEFGAYLEQTRPSNWHEYLLTAYLADGLLRDAFLAMAPGLGSDGERIAAVIGTDTAEAVLRGMLQREFAADPLLAAKMALWGRRIVGDTLLLIRSGYQLPADSDEAEARVTAAFSDLVGGHTRRMDALGLTA